MKNLKREKWVKYIFTIIVIAIVFIGLAHLICTNSERIKRIEEKCDQAYGRTCTWYEVENFKGRS